MTEPTPGGADGFVTRRQLVLTMATSFGAGAAAGISGVRIWRRLLGSPFMPFWGVLDKTIPPGGVKTTLIFGDSIQKVIAAGALDPEKFRVAYGPKERMPVWLEKVVGAPSSEPIVFSPETAPNLLNLLWPLGLCTKIPLNDKSPINTNGLSSFASTAGWTLGREPNGAAYFNKVPSLTLTGEQQERVRRVATTTFRPCCDNPTFFQDCNHGSALLGLIELGAAQGKTTEELYRLSLTANSYWFPEQYAKTALYFALFEGKDWNEVDPKVILGPDFSTLSGWQGSVNVPIRLANFLSRTGRMAQHGCAT
jgi:hypothetical protein